MAQQRSLGYSASPMPAPTWLVVPCFNEAARLDETALLQSLEVGGWNLLFVNDGSTDGTGALLERLRGKAPERIRVLALDENQGKAEAVRQGLGSAADLGAEMVGYFDADLATPAQEMKRVVDACRGTGKQVAMGSRIAFLGADISRTALRHYLGRVFATGASVALGLRVYDTQCGAKAFLNTPALRAALRTPFRSRWIFDVELIARLVEGGLQVSDFVEVPLQEWRGVGGSKLRPSAMARAGLELLRFALARRRP